MLACTGLSTVMTSVVSAPPHVPSTFHINLIAVPEVIVACAGDALALSNVAAPVPVRTDHVPLVGKPVSVTTALLLHTAFLLAEAVTDEGDKRMVTAVSDAVHAPDPTPFLTVKVNVNGEAAAAVMVADAELWVPLLMVTPVDGLTVHWPVAPVVALNVMEEVVVRQIVLVELAVNAVGAVLITVTAVSEVKQAPVPTPFVLVKVKVKGDDAAEVIVADAVLDVALFNVTPVAGLTDHCPAPEGVAPNVIVLLVDPHITLVELAVKAAGAVLMTVTAVSEVEQAPDPTPLVLVKVKVNGEEAADVMVADAVLEVALFSVTPVVGLTVH